ncbi:alpha/beta fold hydrolase [Lacisediminimonas profundi]|uniref:alpha/beta fold hydrolase n=1 Tax=Lacisediminimonas profundi TaxID=2603856 RepID=UPI00124B2986|nr:alpha/beta fold hydrolase [Lacisediminimonas profundi]
MQPKRATPGAVRRATRVLLVLQACAVLGIYIAAIRFLDVNSPFLALVGGIACVLLLRLLIVGNNFVLAVFYQSPTPPEHRLGWTGLLRLFFHEYASSMASSSWTMAFRSFDKRAFSNPAGLPVLLIHGYGCNSGYWHAMSRVLVHARITHYAVDLEPVFSDIDGFVPQVHEAVQRVCRETGAAQIILLAHSMGGLVARAYLRDHGSEHIRKVITLGTPHQGTGLANFGLGPNSRQMRWTGRADKGQASQWLQRLEAREDKQRRSLFVSIYSHHDNIVSPQQSSRLPDATNIEFNGIGHVALGMSPAIHQAVVAEILRASQ